MSPLTLYYSVPSRGMVAHWMLEELGQPYEKIILDMAKEEHKSEAFLTVNPMGRVPALKHGDVVVTETAAIVAYLADAFPDSDLGVGLDSPDRGSYLRWLFFSVASAEPAILRQAMGDLDIDYEPWSDVETVAQTLADAVRGKSYVVAGRFTAADVMLGTTIMWGTQLMPVLPALPEITEYWQRLSQREAWQRASQHDFALMEA